MQVMPRGLALAALAAVLIAGPVQAQSQSPAGTPSNFAAIAKSSGEPQVPGLAIVYLSPLGDPREAPWKNIIVHQTEGPPGSALHMAKRQARNPKVRGVTIWVETDGTVYWSTPETAVPLHGDGANRNDNKFIRNLTTYRQVIHTNSIGVEFVGNFPDVRKPATEQQVAAWLVLVKFLQERYGIPAERVYAHNWIDYKDHRYCEGCELGQRARELAYVPGSESLNAGAVVKEQMTPAAR